MDPSPAPATWPDLAIGLYDRLTARNAEICCELDNFEIHVPAKPGDGGGHATWKINGALKIRTRDGDR